MMKIKKVLALFIVVFLSSSVYAIKENEKDKEVVLTAVKKDASSLQYASEKLKNDKFLIFSTKELDENITKEDALLLGKQLINQLIEAQKNKNYKDILYYDIGKTIVGANRWSNMSADEQSKIFKELEKHLDRTNYNNYLYTFINMKGKKLEINSSDTDMSLKFYNTDGKWLLYDNGKVVRSLRDDYKMN